MVNFIKIFHEKLLVIDCRASLGPLFLQLLLIRCVFQLWQQNEGMWVDLEIKPSKGQELQEGCVQGRVRIDHNDRVNNEHVYDNGRNECQQVLSV